MRKILFLFVCMLVLGCGPGNITDKNLPQAALKNPDEIVFMAFSIRKDSVQNKNIVALLQTTKAAAKMKKQPNAGHSENYLTFEIYAKEKLLQTQIIEHPLFIRIEFPDVSNQYISKETNINKAEFFFRFQTDGANRIRLYETIKGQSKTELLTLNL